jgi:putative redox protein
MKNNKNPTVVLTNNNYLSGAKMRNHFVTIVQAVEDGGRDNGPTPVAYLRTAIGSCVAITLSLYVQRKQWDVGKITVDVFQKEEETSNGIIKILEEQISFENEITP